ncbi:MAG: hypothetical protein N4A64_02180 [Marinisporobacter sp.]|jgi:argonaute-like protein implicated in RNA metabolism and viral defense|nr:hypothetical protein [Marinisporobacter sp.]
MSYIKENTAYLCSTNPRDHIGMAQPIKIVHRYGEKDIKDIVEDIYNLSFMHIGSLIKTRLPVTIHYADLSSTFSSRGWMLRSGDGKALHFV